MNPSYRGTRSAQHKPETLMLLIASFSMVNKEHLWTPVPMLCHLPYL